MAEKPDMNFILYRWTCCEWIVCLNINWTQIKKYLSFNTLHGCDRYEFAYIKIKNVYVSVSICGYTWSPDF